MKTHVRKGDTVIILAGKDRGKRGKVLTVFPEDRKVLVEGVNIVKRHTRPRPPSIPQGGIISKAMPIHSSKAMLICPSCNEPTRISKKSLEDKSRVRVCKKCDKDILRS